LWWDRFGPLFAADIRRRRVNRMRGFRQWRWHLDEMYVKLNGELVYLWRAVDQEGEILDQETGQIRGIRLHEEGAVRKLTFTSKRITLDLGAG